MKRILRLSALLGAFVAAVCLTTLTPGLQSSASAYGILSIGPGGVNYYSGYGQGYYGGYGQGYSQPYGNGYAPNGYYGYGNGPYGYGSPGVTVYGNNTYYSRHHHDSGPVYYGRNHGPVYSPYGYGRW